MHPTLLRLGSFRLATYGVLVASGYLLAIWWLSRRRERLGLSEDDFWNLIYVIFGGAILGGKLLYLGVSWRDIAAGTLHPLRDFRYGFVFYGGVLGSMLAGGAWCRHKGWSFARLSDTFAVALPVGQAVGRWGCLMAGCCYGRPTTMPWGITFTSPECLVSPELLGRPLHPTQLYESAADLLVAWLCWKALARVERKEWRAGAAF
ncbi:MAG: prolipoprotein diacylglyceryl transferase, partial [Elusimicrobia bacterium]|nr:prolipoprotein diacylglyceryl transferase [Elusimicrobiota bacterium]